MRPIVDRDKLAAENIARQERSQLKFFWQREQEILERTLTKLLDCPPGGSERLYAAMQHAVLAPAKRLRPILCIATYKSLQGDDDSIYYLASAIEMLHTYSLIHDDLPCMDDDDTRRGRPTVHVAYDEATAVLAGDALQAYAFELLSSNFYGINRLIARAVGPMGMAGGQLADLEAEGQPATEETVTRIHELKTGRLIVASIVAGAMHSGRTNNSNHYTPLYKYGHALGLAFQIVDDILELTESPEQLGKPTGSDIKHKKVTYPAAVGIDAARERAKSLAEGAKGYLHNYIGDPSLLLAMADFIVSRDR